MIIVLLIVDDVGGFCGFFTYSYESNKMKVKSNKIRQSLVLMSRADLKHTEKKAALNAFST